MVGSSASASAGELSFFTAGLLSAGATATCAGDACWPGKGEDDPDAGAAGWGRAAITGADGRATVPGMKEKSSASEEEIHGTCSLREARVTPMRVRLSVSSAISSGTRISLSSCCTNRLRSLPLSEITEESAAEYITSVPLGAITGARPAEKLRKRRSKGLRLLASTNAILTPAPRLLISPSTVSRLKPSRRTSASVQIWASTGIMKLWRFDCTPKPLKKISATEPGLMRL